MMNKTSCQNILKNLNAKQDHKINSAKALLKGREMVFKAFGSGMFLKTEELKKGTGLKVLTPKQMLRRLPIALAQIEAGNNSESLLNEIRQIVYSLYQSKEITKKMYSNIIKSINVKYKMDTIFVNSENSRTSEYHVLVLKLTDKLDLKRG